MPVGIPALIADVDDTDVVTRAVHRYDALECPARRR
jgi:hypothetical protein